jgi:hypothetical protein
MGKSEGEGINPLFYVSKRLRDDPEVIQQVATQCDTLDYASKRLCESADFVISILTQHECTTRMRKVLDRNCPFLSCDIKFVQRVLAAMADCVVNMEEAAEVILWFNEWFRTDYDAASTMVETAPFVVKFMSDELKNDLYFWTRTIQYTVEANPSMVSFASKEVQDFFKDRLSTGTHSET